MPQVPKNIVQAVLAGDLAMTRKFLGEGASPNQEWGEYPLITHAALIPDASIFRALLEYGSIIPGRILNHIFTWELCDWRVISGTEEAELVEILGEIRGSTAWQSLAARKELASVLDGYEMPDLLHALMSDESGRKDSFAATGGSDSSTLAEWAERLRREAHADEVSFSELLRAARAIPPATELADRIARLTESLLTDPDVKVGQWHEKDWVFVVWQGTIHDLVSRVLSEWRNCPGKPMPGDVAWFTAVDVRKLPYIVEAQAAPAESPSDDY
jgi:hypothetical protein